MVWYGVVLCGVVWYGMVWWGVVLCGVVWYGVVWYGMVWCGVVGCGVVWCGINNKHILSIGTGISHANTVELFKGRFLFKRGQKCFEREKAHSLKQLPGCSSPLTTGGVGEFDLVAPLLVEDVERLPAAHSAEREPTKEGPRLQDRRRLWVLLRDVVATPAVRNPRHSFVVTFLHILS